MLITRPMLAAPVSIETFDKVKWPVWASPKIDGIRCLIHPTLGPVTRTFKSIPNTWVRETLLAHYAGSHLDGELYILSKTGEALFGDTQSAIMSRSGQPEFRYAVFDCFERPEESFVDRHNHAARILMDCGRFDIAHILHHDVIHSVKEFIVFVDECMVDGYEGAVIRAIEGQYKSGRSTLNQGGMLKYKNWVDAEGIVIGFEELMHNDNEDIKNHFGLAKRTSHKDNLIPAGVLGALILQTDWGVLRVGSGFDSATRKAIWERNKQVVEVLRNPEQGVIYGKGHDLGRIVTFKYQPHGMQDLPRFPIWKGFRED